MEKKKSVTARVQVYELLKNDISNGVYPAGYKLREQELSDRYQISRSPIREALRQLASEGLVTEIPNHGATVKEMSVKEAMDLFDARLMLESNAIEQISPEIIEKRKTELFSLLFISEQAYLENDMKLYTMMDKKLHSVIVSMCGNDLIVEFYNNISVRSNWFRKYALSAPGRIEEAVSEHRETIEALCSGNIQGAALANRNHLIKAKECVVLYLQNHKAK